MTAVEADVENGKPFPDLVVYLTHEKVGGERVDRFNLEHNGHLMGPGDAAGSLGIGPWRSQRKRLLACHSPLDRDAQTIRQFADLAALQPWVIAVVDSGVDLDHPDLDGKIVGGATFIDCAGQPNGCGNGDWESGGQAAGAGDPHGTHVAGIAAAETDNGIGVAGVARDAGILAVKALGEEGGSFEDIAAGIRWSVDHGADVVNLSLGALPGVQALTITGVIADVQEAIAYARANGVVVVAAAGNDTASMCGTPGFDEGALCVASTDRNELRAWYSNFAFKPDLATVSGPGGAGTLECRDDISSTVPADAEDGFCETSEGTPGYDFYAGTSMATPAVSGVAALLPPRAGPTSRPSTSS